MEIYVDKASTTYSTKRYLIQYYDMGTRFIVITDHGDSFINCELSKQNVKKTKNFNH